MFLCFGVFDCENNCCRYGGTRWRSWLRHCTTNREVAGSIPDGVILPAALWPWAFLSLQQKWVPGIFRVPNALKSGNLNLLETSGSVQASNGIALPYINTFAASYLNTQGLNNSCLKSPASTLVDLTFQSRALRSFSLNQLRNLSL